MVSNVSLILCSTVVPVNSVSSVDGEFTTVVEHCEILHCTEDTFETNHKSIAYGLDVSESNCTSCVLEGTDAVIIYEHKPI